MDGPSGRHGDLPEFCPRKKVSNKNKDQIKKSWAKGSFSSKNFPAFVIDTAHANSNFSTNQIDFSLSY